MKIGTHPKRVTRPPGHPLMIKVYWYSLHGHDKLHLVDQVINWMTGSCYLPAQSALNTAPQYLFLPQACVLPSMSLVERPRVPVLKMVLCLTSQSSLPNVLHGIAWCGRTTR